MRCCGLRTLRSWCTGSSFQSKHSTQGAPRAIILRAHRLDPEYKQSTPGVVGRQSGSSLALRGRKKREAGKSASKDVSSWLVVVGVSLGFTSSAEAEKLDGGVSPGSTPRAEAEGLVGGVSFGVTPSLEAEKLGGGVSLGFTPSVEAEKLVVGVSPGFTPSVEAEKLVGGVSLGCTPSVEAERLGDGVEFSFGRCGRG